METYVKFQRVEVRGPTEKNPRVCSCPICPVLFVLFYFMIIMIIYSPLKKGGYLTQDRDSRVEVGLEIKINPELKYYQFTSKIIGDIYWKTHHTT